MSKKINKHPLFLQWSIYAISSFFILWLSWKYQILSNLFIGDTTKVSYLIVMLFVMGSLHCGYRAFYLSRQLNALTGIVNKVESKHFDDSLPAMFTNSLLRKLQKEDQATKSMNLVNHDQLVDTFVEEVYALKQFEWFFLGMQIRLGIIGSVIGFMLVLGPLDMLETINNQGMGVVLNTLIVGLIGSMLLGFQYLLVDRGADELITRTLQYIQAELVGTANTK